MSRARKPSTLSLSGVPCSKVAETSWVGRPLLAGGALLSLAVLVGLGMVGAPAHAAFPGENGKIACGGPLGPVPPPAGGSSLEIFDIDPSGGGERRLTNDTNSDASPRYSADGRRIVFNKDNQIWTMNADGTNPTRLTFTTGANTAGSWSPDGTQITFQSTRDVGGSFEIYKMNADGSNQTRLTDNPAEDSLPNWSPDGRKIVFNSRRLGSPDLFTINPDGSSPTQLTNFPGEEAAAQWSPDGRQLVFHSDRDAFPRSGIPRNLEIYRINADGAGNPTRLTTQDFVGGGNLSTDFTGFDLFPAWSPAGDRIVFHSGRTTDLGTSQWEVFTINAVDGGDIRRLTTRAGNDERCNWQPIPRAATPPVYPPVYPGPPVPPQPRIRPNMLRPGGSARQARRRIRGRVRGRMTGNQGRSCRGRVRIGIRFGGNRRITRITRMGSNCRYSRRFTFPTRRLPARLRPRRRTVILRIAARFQGNAGLRPDTSPTARVRVRR